MSQTVDCDCPCHKGKTAPHDEFRCPQCDMWNPYGYFKESSKAVKPDEEDPLARAPRGHKEDFFRR